MSVIKNASIEAATSQDAQELNQLHSIPGFETCQGIPAIKAELARLDKVMKNSGPGYPHIHSAVRYWAIRWVMGWEKEIPE